jgi:hypothetical protein
MAYLLTSIKNPALSAIIWLVLNNSFLKKGSYRKNYIRKKKISFVSWGWNEVAENACWLIWQKLKILFCQKTEENRAKWCHLVTFQLANYFVDRTFSMKFDQFKWSSFDNFNFIFVDNNKIKRKKGNSKELYICRYLLYSMYLMVRW